MNFVAAAGGSGLPLPFVLVYVAGFIAAISVGSIAWYNSKRPAGWEDKERPDFVPEVGEGKEDSGSQSQGN